MAKRFAYLEGQKVRRKEAEKLQQTALEPLESVYIRKETTCGPGRVHAMLGCGAKRRSMQFLLQRSAKKRVTESGKRRFVRFKK